MTSQLHNLETFLDYCKSESNDGIRNALSGIMANGLKFPWSYSVDELGNNILHI